MATPSPWSPSQCWHFRESLFLTQLMGWTSVCFHSEPRKLPDYVILGIKSHVEVGGMNLRRNGAMAKEPCTLALELR